MEATLIYSTPIYDALAVCQNSVQGAGDRGVNKTNEILTLQLQLVRLKTGEIVSKTYQRVARAMEKRQGCWM